MSYYNKKIELVTEAGRPQKIGAKPKKIFISDIDGTLANNQGQLSQFTIDNLNKVIHSGVPFTVASARSVFSIQQVLKDVSLKLPIISFNGAFVSCFEEGTHEVINAIDSEKARELYEIVKSFQLSPFISTYNGSDCLYHDKIINDGMVWYKDNLTQKRDIRLRPGFDLNTLFKQEIICINSIGRKEELEPLQNLIVEKYGDVLEVHLFQNDYNPGWYWLTLHDHRSRKDRGCEVVCEKLGFTMNDLTVFGDNINDIRMFKAAGRAVAVGSAVETAKECADEIIEDNLSDSVVKYILDH